MLWAMGIITANYLGYFKGSIDVTFARPCSFYGSQLRLTMNRMGKKKKEESVIVDNSKTGIKQASNDPRQLFVLGITCVVPRCSLS